MGFKIINITDKLPPRSSFYNTELKINYSDGIQTQTKMLSVGEELVVQLDRLPISIHKLQILNHVRVLPISDNDIALLGKVAIIKEPEEKPKKKKTPKMKTSTTKTKKEQEKE